MAVACSDGNEEMYSRGGRPSSEVAKKVNALSRATERLVADVEHARVQIEREAKKAKVSRAREAAAKQQVASLQAEVSALYSGDPRDPRLSFRGRMLAQSLTKEAMKELAKEKVRS